MLFVCIFLKSSTYLWLIGYLWLQDILWFHLYHRIFLNHDWYTPSEVALIGLRVCQWQQEVLDIPKFCSPEFVGSWQLWVAIGTNRWQLGATKSLISWSLVNFVLYPLNSSLPAISAKLPNICHGTNPATLALDKANRKAQLSKKNVLILRLLAS
jgi:hypothetical protein